jgi:hypothetical protein
VPPKAAFLLDPMPSRAGFSFETVFRRLCFQILEKELEHI